MLTTPGSKIKSLPAVSGGQPHGVMLYEGNRNNFNATDAFANAPGVTCILVSASTNSGTAITTTQASPAGNTLVAVLFTTADTDTSVLSVVDSAGNIYLSAGTVTPTSGFYTSEIFYCLNANALSAGGTITGTIADGSSYAVVLYSVSNANGGVVGFGNALSSTVSLVLPVPAVVFGMVNYSGLTYVQATGFNTALAEFLGKPASSADLASGYMIAGAGEAVTYAPGTSGDTGVTTTVAAFGLGQGGIGPIVQIANAKNIASGSSTTTTATAPAGSLIVVAAGAYNTEDVNVTNVTDNAGNTYVQAVQNTLTSGVYNQSIWYCSNCPNALPSGGTITVTVSGGYFMTAWAVQGANGGLGPTASTVNATAGTSLSLALAAPTQTPAIVFGVMNPNTGVTNEMSSELTTLAGYSWAQCGIFASPSAMTWNASWTNSSAYTAVLATFYGSLSPTAQGVQGGQTLIGQSVLSDPMPLPITGDASLAANGALTVLTSQGVTLGPLASEARPANSQNTITTAPTKPSSTTAYQMQGLAGSIKPAASGTILVSISAYCTATATTATNGINAQISYGTGTAPGSNAALTGTQVGNIASFEVGTTLTAAADLKAPIDLQAVITGLTVGTTYWLDLAAEAIGSTTIGLNQISISAIELP